MIRSVIKKVLWVGRGTSTILGLAIVLAVVFGVATTAVGATGGNFLLGKSNAAGAVSKLTANIAGPALQLVNTSADAAATALNLTVASGKPPLKVSAGSGTATNLSADKLDGKDSSQFLGASGKAIDSDKLDGLDSAAFGITTAHNYAYSPDCDTPNTWNQCGPIQVVVPDGKQYVVSVWSSLSVAGGSTDQTINYCSGDDQGCITPGGAQERVTVPANKTVAASAEGEKTLGPGTYTFSTWVFPQSEFANTDTYMITKVMVRDASSPGPTGVSIP